MYVRAGDEPHGYFVPLPNEPIRHFVPKGDPQVHELARVAGQQAQAYVRDTLDPQVSELRALARRQLPDRLFDEARTRIELLRSYVHALPGTVSEQLSQATDIEDLTSVVVDDPILHREINQLQSSYPWMAPHLVRLRHAVSRQAIDKHVLGPAGDQMGI